MTTRFASAADLMARVLGFPGYAFATIAHPVSSADDDGLRERAEATVAELRRRLPRA